jgi:hypothetical protein
VSDWQTGTAELVSLKAQADVRCPFCRQTHRHSQRRTGFLGPLRRAGWDRPNARSSEQRVSAPSHVPVSGDRAMMARAKTLVYDTPVGYTREEV